MEQRKTASALKYKRGEDSAPKVVANGQGLVAERILAAAEENQVPVYEQPELAEQLRQLKLGAEIPESLYEAVAEVLIFIAQLDQKKKAKG